MTSEPWGNPAPHYGKHSSECIDDADDLDQRQLGWESDWPLGVIESAKRTLVDSGLSPVRDPE